jgi:hypothetical protein
MIDFRSKRRLVRECRKRLSAIQRPPEQVQGRKMTILFGEWQKGASCGHTGTYNGYKNLRKGRSHTTIMTAVARERLPGGPGHLQELHPQAGDARKILIEGDDGQVAFQGGGRNERVHIPD